MNAELSLGIKKQIKSFLKNTRVQMQYSVAEASNLLNISEDLLLEYEAGEKSPPCNQLAHIIMQYGANPEFLSFEVALVQQKYSRRK